MSGWRPTNTYAANCTARTRINPRDAETLLLAAAREGDQLAFRELYQQQVRHVRALARQVLHTQDVDDVCQEVFLRAFTRIGSFQEASSFRTWISRITLYECFRSRGRCSTMVPLEDTMAVCEHGLAGVTERLDVSRMLETLGPVQRKMVEMAYLEEKPAAEIAVLFDTTVAQVKSSLHRAKRRLGKKYVSDADPE